MKEKKLTFHLLGLSHVETSKRSYSCAYTQKVVNLGYMLKSMGHKVFFYGVEGSEVDCDEYIVCCSKEELNRDHPVIDGKFYHLEHMPSDDVFDKTAIEEINKRKERDHFLLCMYGWGHKKIADGVGLHLTCEPGIGYSDTMSDFRVFESYGWQSYVYGRQGTENGKNYDVVIPNYYNLDDFTYSNEKDDYFLYMGRLIHRKGITIAIQAIERTGKKLIVAGPDCGENVGLDHPFVEYIGPVNFEQRRKLLSRAKALLVPTQYIPPFEGVHAEAGLSGTPVITSDWACFGECVDHGVTGFRCRTMEHYTWAINNIERIKPRDCYVHAVGRYNRDLVKELYHEYFGSCHDIVIGSGWYAEHPERTSAGWSVY